MNRLLSLNLPISIIDSLIFRLKFNQKILRILIFLIILTLLAFYIFQANALVSERYLLSNYQKKLNEKLRENEVLLINSTQLNSLSNIKEKVKAMGFEKVDKVYYLKVLENQIVTK